MGKCETNKSLGGRPRRHQIQRLRVEAAYLAIRRLWPKCDKHAAARLASRLALEPKKYEFGLDSDKKGQDIAVFLIWSKLDPTEIDDVTRRLDTPKNSGKNRYTAEEADFVAASGSALVTTLLAKHQFLAEAGANLLIELGWPLDAVKTVLNFGLILAGPQIDAYLTFPKIDDMKRMLVRPEV